MDVIVNTLLAIIALIILAVIYHAIGMHISK